MPEHIRLLNTSKIHILVRQIVNLYYIYYLNYFIIEELNLYIVYNLFLHFIAR